MRQVYFDPFGSRLAGQRAGVQDEMALQDQTRRARTSDWQYNNIAPLQLSQAQREDRIAAAGEPYAIRDFGLNESQKATNLFASQQPWYERVGQVTGNYAPALTNAASFGLGTQQFVQNQDYFAPQVAATDARVRGGLDPASDAYEGVLRNYATTYGIDPDAFVAMQRANPFVLDARAEQGYDNFLNYDRSRQMAQDQYGRQDVDWNRQIQEATLQRQYDEQAQSEAWRQWQMQQALMNRMFGGFGAYSPAGAAEGGGGSLYGM